MPSITYASSLEVEVYILVVDAGLNYVTVSYQSMNLLNIFLSKLIMYYIENSLYFFKQYFKTFEEAKERATELSKDLSLNIAIKAESNNWSTPDEVIGTVFHEPPVELPDEIPF